MGVLAHFSPLGTFGLGGISTFWHKVRQEKLLKLIKDSEL